MGGEYAIANLRSMSARDGMRYRGSVATQIKDLPDGAKVELTTTREQ
jgi:hypothetical protein